MNEEEISMKKEVIHISGDRNLYNYTFELNGQELPAMEENDLRPGPPPKDEQN